MTDLGMSLGDYNLQQAFAMNEKTLQSVVVGCAKRQGWLVYHTKFSMGSAPGYPDLHLVHEQRHLSLFRELKTEHGRLTEHQIRWIDALTLAGHDVAVWRPLDWFEERISNELFPESS